MNVGMTVRTPDTYCGVICEVDENGVYVMWGDNNRKRYTLEQARRFVVVTS